MNKQIIKMAKDLCHARDCHIKNEPTECYHGCKAWVYAERAVNKGYKKAIEGEWVDQYKGKYANALYKCSVCGEPAYGNGKVWFFSKFCPNCGAKMKYESEGADDV